ncbi:hypothetical protein L596_009824 [Steinernema carpocapsae]|uniref:Secreted protein n=1 Tax=Steinernema carpocapsae TaxID=34508 RepID=A0A4U5PGG8_STECR|nr:hypothetical protein L596_009824 [Steinernema carpocapsae]
MKNYVLLLLQRFVALVTTCFSLKWRSASKGPIDRSASRAPRWIRLCRTNNVPSTGSQHGLFFYIQPRTPH